MNNYLIGTHTITLHDIVIVAPFGPLVRDSITECDSSSVDTSMLSSIKLYYIHVPKFAKEFCEFLSFL